MTFISKKSGASTILIEAAYNYWSGGDRSEKEGLVSIPITTAGSYDKALYSREGQDHAITTLIKAAGSC